VFPILYLLLPLSRVGACLFPVTPIPPFFFPEDLSTVSFPRDFRLGNPFHIGDCPFSALSIFLADPCHPLPSVIAFPFAPRFFRLIWPILLTLQALRPLFSYSRLWTLKRRFSQFVHCLPALAVDSSLRFFSSRPPFIYCGKIPMPLGCQTHINSTTSKGWTA